MEVLVKKDNGGLDEISFMYSDVYQGPTRNTTVTIANMISRRNYTDIHEILGSIWKFLKSNSSFVEVVPKKCSYEVYNRFGKNKIITKYCSISKRISSSTVSSIQTSKINLGGVELLSPGLLEIQDFYQVSGEFSFIKHFDCVLDSSLSDLPWTGELSMASIINACLIYLLNKL